MEEKVTFVRRLKLLLGFSLWVFFAPQENLKKLTQFFREMYKDDNIKTENTNHNN